MLSRSVVEGVVVEEVYFGKEVVLLLVPKVFGFHLSGRQQYKSKSPQGLVEVSPIKLVAAEGSSTR